MVLNMEALHNCRTNKKVVNPALSHTEFLSMENPLFEFNFDAVQCTYALVRLKVEIGTFTLSFFYFSHLAVKLHF